MLLADHDMDFTPCFGLRYIIGISGARAELRHAFISPETLAGWLAAVLVET